MKSVTHVQRRPTRSVLDWLLTLLNFSKCHHKKEKLCHPGKLSRNPSLRAGGPVMMRTMTARTMLDGRLGACTADMGAIGYREDEPTVRYSFPLISPKRLQSKPQIGTIVNAIMTMTKFVPMLIRLRMSLRENRRRSRQPKRLWTLRVCMGPRKNRKPSLQPKRLGTIHLLVRRRKNRIRSREPKRRWKMRFCMRRRNRSCGRQPERLWTFQSANCTHYNSKRTKLVLRQTPKPH